MPKKKADPKDTPEAQHERFKQAAKEAGATDGKKFEDVFRAVVPPKKPQS